VLYTLCIHVNADHHMPRSPYCSLHPETANTVSIAYFPPVVLNMIKPDREIE
jgi:hypothetical protein